MTGVIPSVATTQGTESREGLAMHQSSGINSSWINSSGINGFRRNPSETAIPSRFKSRFKSGFGRQAACGIALAQVLGLAGFAIGSFTGSLLLVPLVAQAYTTEDLLSVSRETGEDYNALIRRAEDAARASAQQQFASDILLTRVIITVLGENGGDTVPLLRLDVNREDWRRRPDPQYWATYYRTSRALLDLSPAAPAARTTQPTPVPVPATPEQTPDSAPATPNQPGNPNVAPGAAGVRSINPVPISIPATPAGQTGLPRSILR
jgi:hypothetical protein